MTSGGKRKPAKLEPETVLLQDGFDTGPDDTSEWRAAAETVDWLVWRAKGEDSG